MPRRSAATIPEDTPPAPLTMEDWQAQPECPYCHCRPGQNPQTGMWVRYWDAATRTYVDGHRYACQRPKEG